MLRCLRVARISESTEAETWFRLELRGYRAGVAPDDNWARWASLSGREANKSSDGQQLFWTAPIEHIETICQLARDELKILILPDRLPEAQQSSSPYLHTVPEKILQSVQLSRTTKSAEVQRWSHIIACLRGAVQEWLSVAVVQLKYGTQVDNAFWRTKTRIDAFLSDRAPQVARELAAAFARVPSVTAEELSQASASCRRALKALADALYAPTDDESSGHKLTDAQYINRLVQFVKEHPRSDTQTELTATELKALGERLDKLDDLANKGLHATATSRDVDLTIVRTYFIAGEILELLPNEPQRLPASGAPDIDATATGVVASDERNL